jgi:predicted O-methyltransferase YrrM
LIAKTLAHCIRVGIGSELPHTQTTQAERDLLAKHLPGRRHIVEVGVFEGFTTRVLTEASDPDATVYGIDPFFTGRAGISWGLVIARHYNRAHLATGKLKLIRSLSTEVADKVPENVDFVFIDADHSLDGIKADWAFWSERTSVGGIVALHDTLVPPNRSKLPEYGSHRYFRSHIQHDPRFETVGKIDSMAILVKK